MKNWKRLAQILLLCACTSANAGAHEIDAYLAAAQEFEKITAEKTDQGRMPRLEDNSVAELIATLSDSKRFLNSASYQKDDLDTLHNMCAKTNTVIMSYILFNLKSHVKKGEDQAMIVKQAGNVMYKNILFFQNELEQLQPFLIRCLATEMPLLTEFVATLKPEEFTEIRRSGLQQARNGVLSIYYGYLQSISNQELRISFKEKVIQSLADAAIPFASIIQPAIRQQILGLATTIEKTASGETVSNLRKIIDAMSATECTGLCKL